MLGPPSKAEVQDCEAIIVVGLPGSNSPSIIANNATCHGFCCCWDYSAVVFLYLVLQMVLLFVFALEESPCHVLWLEISTTPAARLPVVHDEVQKRNSIVRTMGMFPGSGKSTWCQKYAEEQPSRRFMVLSAATLVDQMLVSHAR